MKKFLSTIIFALILSVIVAPLANAQHFDQMDDYYRDNNNSYYNFPSGNSQFHPQDPDYYNGNKRYKIKTKSGIEHSSGSNLHYDEYKRDYYRCNWVYNKNLGSWACDKDYGTASKAQPVQVCPVGYTFSTKYQTCLSGSTPIPVKTVVVYQPVQTIVIQPTRTYYSPKPVRLPSTGPATNWVLFMVAVGLISSFSLSRMQNKNK